MKNIFKHLKIIFIHKWYVFKAMCDCGKPFQGFMHDWSKFSPTEFLESIKYYKGTSSPIDEAKRVKGYSDAWFHHRGRNKHHSQYWCDISFGEVKPCKIPWKYVVELICDGIGASKAYSKNEWNKSIPLQYYNNVDSKSFYHADVRKILKQIYEDIYLLGWEKVAHNIDSYKKLYNTNKE